MIVSKNSQRWIVENAVDIASVAIVSAFVVAIVVALTMAVLA